MKSTERRTQIIAMLNGRKEYLNATKMADALEVSRQIIVSDIALLRAQGYKIISTPRGYLLEQIEYSGYVDTIVCCHNMERAQEEFYCIVDNGGEILDVSIDHSIYGLLSATLKIRSRYDANLYLRQVESSDAKPLSALTEGLHTHRIHCANQEDFLRIKEELRKLHILVSN